MKNTIKCFGIIAMVAVIGFAMSGCASLPKLEDYQKISFLEFLEIVKNGDSGKRPKQGLGFIVEGYIQKGILKDKPDSKEGITLYTSKSYASNIQGFSDKFIDNTKIYTVYFGFYEEGSYDTAKGKNVYYWRPLVDKIEGLRTIEEVATIEAQQKANQAQQRDQQKAQQEQEKLAEQTRLATLYRQAGNNFGNLRNTSKAVSGTVGGGGIAVRRYDFGDGNYLYELKTTFHDGSMSDTKTGTFRVNGDTVIFLSSEGVYSFGTIIGNTLTIDGSVYR